MDCSEFDSKRKGKNSSNLNGSFGIFVQLIGDETCKEILSALKSVFPVYKPTARFTKEPANVKYIIIS